MSIIEEIILSEAMKKSRDEEIFLSFNKIQGELEERMCKPSYHFLEKKLQNTKTFAFDIIYPIVPPGNHMAKNHKDPYKHVKAQWNISYSPLIFYSC